MQDAQQQVQAWGERAYLLCSIGSSLHFLKWCGCEWIMRNMAGGLLGLWESPRGWGTTENIVRLGLGSLVGCGSWRIWGDSLGQRRRCSLLSWAELKQVEKRRVNRTAGAGGCRKSRTLYSVEDKGSGNVGIINSAVQSCYSVKSLFD